MTQQHDDVNVSFPVYFFFWKKKSFLCVFRGQRKPLRLSASSNLPYENITGESTFNNSVYETTVSQHTHSSNVPERSMHCFLGPAVALYCVIQQQQMFPLFCPLCPVYIRECRVHNTAQQHHKLHPQDHTLGSIINSTFFWLCQLRGHVVPEYFLVLC